MLVIAKGVMPTGVVSRVTYRLLADRASPTQALRRLIPPVGFVSALINTTPIVAMLIPAGKELQQPPVSPPVACCSRSRMPPRWPGRRR